VLLRDRKTFPWALTSAAIFVIAFGAFVWHVLRSPAQGPSGGSLFGLIFGSIAAAMLYLALLLGARKKLRTWRLGRARTWMQLHVWFGFLCYPIAYFHIGAMRWGSVGSLSWVIMLLLTLVWLSGLVGIALQQYLPKLMFERVSREITFEQHSHVLKLMRAEAVAAVAGAAVELDGERINVEAIAVGTGSRTKAAADSNRGAAARLARFHAEYVGPFLEDRPAAALRVHSHNAADQLFRDLRTQLPETMHDIVADLQLLVDERRQMLSQAAMHRAMHWWLFVHVPLSYGLAVLVALHAFFALRYAG
jgi:hypothetical protein